MKAAIYNPYLDTLGGGERYTISFAKVLADQKYQVDIQWKGTSIKQSLEKRFGIKLDGINFVRDIKRGDGYEVCFWVSDGSIPLFHARKNFLHFQFPFKNVNGKSLINKMKLYRINEIICNSKFTKSFIDEEYGVDSKVLYPPVDIEKIKPKRKKSIILFVGRFSQLTQAKNQDVLISAFKKLTTKNVDGWKLILAGGSEVGAENYLKKLKKKAKDCNIEILESPDFKTIIDLFGTAKIFWSASGFGIDEEKEPKKVEHFGISVVEAMVAGAAPLVIASGGHKEIIEDGKNGYLWKSERELVEKTLRLIDDGKLLRSIAGQAKKDGNKFGYERFEKKVIKLLKN